MTAFTQNCMAVQFHTIFAVEGAKLGLNSGISSYRGLNVA